MDGNQQMASVITEESEDTNAFWADVYFKMKETGCKEAEAVEQITPLYQKS